MNKKPVMMNAGHSDTMQTPSWALQPLLPYLDKSWWIWEPAAGKGNLVKKLVQLGYRAEGTDILMSPEYDFFTMKLPAFHAIVTNPPYSIKDRWIGHCYTIGKPFALLLPLTALGGKFRQTMYRESGLQVIFFDKRVNFEVPSGKNVPWFAVAWFTWGFNLPRDMIFTEIREEN